MFPIKIHWVLYRYMYRIYVKPMKQTVLGWFNYEAMLKTLTCV